MTRPLPHVDTCPDCCGAGGTFEEDGDEESSRMVRVDCEGCANCGEVSSCRNCDEALPASTAELVGYLCAFCVDGLDRRDQAAEMARRWS